MGKFLEKSVGIEQVKGDVFKTLNNLTYISDKTQAILVPQGFNTDGYSKPEFTHILVGDNFSDDIRCSILHDYLCQNHGYYEGKKFYPLTFKEANDLFYEAMRSLGIGRFKACLMRFAVNFNPKRW